MFQIVNTTARRTSGKPIANGITHLGTVRDFLGRVASFIVHAASQAVTDHGSAARTPGPVWRNGRGLADRGLRSVAASGWHAGQKKVHL